MNLNNFKKANLPEKPGVYFFIGTPKEGVGEASKEHILYIGKATSLKDRVRSYFSKDLIETRGPLLVDMVFKATNIKWQETDSVLEALILEANLIKKHQPHYNTKEKDDKSFNYVCISKENTLSVIRGRELTQTKTKFKKTYGPFTNGGQLIEALKIIRKFFPYIEARKGAKGKDEFYKQIKLSPENAEENKSNIKNIMLLFEGKKKKIIQLLKKQMLVLANAQKFEMANEIKRKIFALQHINDVALIKSESLGNLVAKWRIEAYDIAHMSGKNMVGVMTVVLNGEVNKSEYKKFKIRTQIDANDTGALKEVLERRFAHHEWSYPKLIVVDGSTAQMNTAKKVLTSIGVEIPIVGVVKDEKHRPKNIIGDNTYTKKYEKEILLANNEAHRFAITYHKKTRNKDFLKLVNK